MYRKINTAMVLHIEGRFNYLVGSTCARCGQKPRTLATMAFFFFSWGIGWFAPTASCRYGHWRPLSAVPLWQHSTHGAGRRGRLTAGPTRVMPLWQHKLLKRRPYHGQFLQQECTYIVFTITRNFKHAWATSPIFDRLQLFLKQWKGS